MKNIDISEKTYPNGQSVSDLSDGSDVSTGQLTNIMKSREKRDKGVGMAHILPDKELLRPDEVAKYFSVTKQTVYLWISEGKLDALRVCGTGIRISREAVEKVKKPVFD